MTLWINYYLAKNILDALGCLADAPGPARLVAGGTDLLLDLQQGRHLPVHTLVDVTSIPELSLIEIRQAELFIGAAAPLNKIIASPLIREHAQALFEAGSLIGGPQVRNTATLGGNVAHALPAADGTIALLALGATAEVVDSNGSRRLPLEKLFLGPGQSALKARKELLAGFYLPLQAPGQGSAFRRVMRPQGVAIAILNMAIWLERRGDMIEDIRISIGPAGPTPHRARSAENILRGAVVNEHVLSTALARLLAEARFRTSPHRATAEYRRYMSGILLREVFSEAWERSTTVIDF